MEFRIRDVVDGDFVFPVNPEEVSIRRNRQYETVSLIGLGEVDLAQAERIKEISFSSFFPREFDERFCRGKSDSLLPSQVAMNRLTALLIKKRPVRLIISDTIINTPVYVSSHHSTLRGGEPGDIYFEVTFRTWRDIKVQTSGKSKAASRIDMKPVPKIYMVKPGDTLTAIAKRELGSSSKWPDIYNVNTKVIGRDPNLIRPGQKLVMP
ncbi:LysM peptidoglycan-binding domain-containing protein [Cohnella hongkongensis]|uniref:LysM peptidoglycan-binding domain-containing protein n=1 Tax=Cohnella hongkongensis TaxID=178337 RepID=A0ABV9FHN0_9BACL